MVHPRSARTGALLALGAAGLFAVNGAVSKLALTTVEAPRLTALRCLGASAVLLVVVAARTPGRLRLTVREVPLLAAYGVVGVAMTQYLYFVAIARLPVGVALLFEFTAPVFVALWARLVLREPVRRRVWAALALAVGGLALVARVWTGGSGLDRIGGAAGLGAAVALAAYYLLGEHGVARRDPVSLTGWALLFGSLFWALAQPWWRFDPAVLAQPVELPALPGGLLAGAAAPAAVLVAWVVVLGTVVPFSLSVAALAHLRATSVGIVAMAEPVLAAAVAWLWLGEALTPAQLAGGAVVVGGILLAQTARGVERVPPWPARTPGATSTVAAAPAAAVRGSAGGRRRAVGAGVGHHPAALHDGERQPDDGVAGPWRPRPDQGA